MNSDTGHLQKLTNEQVNARLAAYNSDGSLDRDMKLLRDKAGEINDAEVAARFGVSRQTMHAWVAKYEAGGLGGLGDR